jgi:hypothetical protein
VPHLGDGLLEVAVPDGVDQCREHFGDFLGLAHRHHLGFGRIVVSEREAPIPLVILV